MRRMFLGVLLMAGIEIEAALSRADEGMWLFNNPPRKQLAEHYNFDPSDAWLTHLQRSSVRFNSGGSGSFVSSHGLVMTNHHVGADALQKLSTAQKDYLKDGFFAARHEDEVKCLDLELNVLMSIEDVTARVNAAVKPEMSPADAFQARRAVMSTIEKESLDATGLRSDVITLYQGGLYHLYRFKKYTDVRLVFAPEQAIAFFGGDPDNFEYPRYDLDVCFFRVYEEGKPAQITDYLRWSAAGAGDGELIFVSGHPGRTSRLHTMAHLEFTRDVALPYSLRKIYRREVLLSSFSERSIENARRAKDDLFMYQNSRKARRGGLEGLQDPAVMKVKQQEEQALRDAVARDPKLREMAGQSWDQVAQTLDVLRAALVPFDLLEHGSAFDAHLFGIARTLVRLAEESAKPNPQRLREYRESNLESLRQSLFSEAPIYDDLEIVKLSDSLSMLLELLPGDPLVKEVLAGKSPVERAAELIHGSKLGAVELRRKLADGGKAAIEASQDPLILLARLVDPAARKVRKQIEEQVEEPQRQAYGKLAKARFALLGTNTYPDATFTLRLAYGKVLGYTEAGQTLPPWTTIGGAYTHAAAHNNRSPFDLPPRWLERRAKLNLNTPFNFVSTADIIGGNSGSPVVNRQGEVVGLIFDGNLQSLVWDFVYSSAEGRATAVHSSAIREALRSVYDANNLAEELGK